MPEISDTPDEARVATAGRIMHAFAERTGLSDTSKPPQRYLWTDAFAVCNFFELQRRTADDAWRELALALIDQVHQVLGRHRPDDARRGWISGLEEAEGARHPTAGGLRIGKPLPERLPDEPHDAALEWERDGQYFHYLTKWMRALDCASRATRVGRYREQALELAQVAHARFTWAPPEGGPKRMVWKMSIDLTRPLVPSMGQHDPLDGLVTAWCLEASAAAAGVGASAAQRLAAAIDDYAAMCAGMRFATDDPLGLGGLLCDAGSLAQLAVDGPLEARRAQARGLLVRVLEDIAAGLPAWASARPLARPASQRLAFRELGLAIGLSALAGIEQRAAGIAREPGAAVEVRRQLDGLAHYRPLAGAIESFWLDPQSRCAPTWGDHLDINEVMLATALVPDSFLVCASPPAGEGAAP